LGARLNGALALLTGRTIADAERIVGGAVDAIAGVHGMELRLRPHVWARTAPAGPKVESMRTALSELLRRNALDAILEDKGASVALHYRHAPLGEDQVRGVARTLAAAHGLRVLYGKMVVEILAGETTKGDALVELMRVAPFAGRIPVAIGDDVTDEDAFAAVRRLGGVGVLVGPPRATAASCALPDVAAVRAWLAQAAPETRAS
jgi:trehalose 6-phosphate phosphatase